MESLVALQCFPNFAIAQGNFYFQLLSPNAHTVGKRRAREQRAVSTTEIVLKLFADNTSHTSQAEETEELPVSSWANSLLFDCIVLVSIVLFTLTTVQFLFLITVIHFEQKLVLEQSGALVKEVIHPNKNVENGIKRDNISQSLFWQKVIYMEFHESTLQQPLGSFPKHFYTTGTCWIWLVLLCFLWVSI